MRLPRAEVTVAVALGLAALGAAQAMRVPPPDDPLSPTLRALQAQDARVTAAFHRLTTGAVALCPATAPTIGMSVHTIDAYRGAYRRAAARLWGLDRGAGVLAVAPDGPAAQAGIASGDVMLAIDGVPPARPTRSREIGSVLVHDQIVTAAGKGRVTLTIVHDGVRRDIGVAPMAACASRFEVTTGDDLAARADGGTIQISGALVDEADTDDALAGVLAHELAHNVLRHRVRLEAAKGGKRDRLFWSREIEIEADRFSLRLLDRAGFSVDTAIGFWTDYARRLARAISGRGTHPDWEARIAAMRDERRLIAAAR